MTVGIVSNWLVVDCDETPTCEQGIFGLGTCPMLPISFCLFVEVIGGKGPPGLLVFVDGLRV
jgi:hypothetical protein